MCCCRCRCPCCCGRCCRCNNGAAEQISDMIRYLDMRAKKYEQQQQQTRQQQLRLQRQLLLQQQKMLPLRVAACAHCTLSTLAACNCQVCCLLKSFVLGPHVAFKFDLYTRGPLIIGHCRRRRRRCRRAVCLDNSRGDGNVDSVARP